MASSDPKNGDFIIKNRSLKEKSSLVVPNVENIKLPAIDSA